MADRKQIDQPGAMKRCSLWILLIGIVISFIAFLPSFDQIFRSDEWLIANFAFNNPINLPTILKSMRFEMFGDSRSQPLAFLLSFIVHAVFKTNFLLYHILAYLIHIANGLLIYLILARFLKQKVLASMAGVYFINMFLHADTVLWTHYIYITLQLTLFLSSILLFLKFLDEKRTSPLLASMFLLLISPLLYEALLFVCLILVPLFFYRALTQETQGEKKALSVFSISLIGFYTLYLSFFILSHMPGEITASSIPARLSGGIRLVFLIVRNNLFTFFSLPPEYFFEDISYIVLKEKTIFASFFIFLFIFYFFIFLYRSFKKREDLAPVFFYLTGLTYIFTISFARARLYVATQPRYMYFLDALLLIVTVFIIKEIFRFIKGKPLVNTLTGISFAVFGFLIITNAHQTYRFSNDIRDILKPVQHGFYDIKSFLKSGSYDGYSRIFIEDPPHPKDWRLFLGKGIYLETLFYDKEIFTRRIRDARYLYNAAEGVIPNPLYKTKDAGDKDFTIEFDLTLIPGARNITILGGKESLLGLIVDENIYLLFGGKWRGAEAAMDRYFKVPILPLSTSRLIVGKESDLFYVLQNGRLIYKEDIGGLALAFRDEDLFLGTVPYFPPQRCYLENFSAWIGKSKYNIRSSLGDKFYNGNMRSPVPHLETHYDYYIKSYRYIKDDPILKILN